MSGSYFKSFRDRWRNKPEPGGDERFEERRRRMVEVQLRSRGIRDPGVLAAFAKVPRHELVPPSAVNFAYDDHPLSIGHGQTISQPYMVALMTQELRLSGGERVLEIGTGSGYQAAILAEMKARVFSMERIAALSQSACEALSGLGYDEIRFKVDDGTLGWPEEAPFDRIVVTAGSPSVPASLKSQLVDGGILVIPTGDATWQSLLVLTRKGDGFHERNACGCVFVKLKGREGWPE